MITSSQFAADCIGLTDHPHPKGKTAAGAHCWLCGGSTQDRGWPLRDAINTTFTNHNRAAFPASDAVCWQCVAMSFSESWARYVARHPERGLSAHFPQKEGKNLRAANWLYFSHLFREGWHETPSRARWREILLAPPEPPFLAVISTSGQKHLIFRARVARSRDRFWLQFEEETVWFAPARFAPVLQDFEALCAMGFSKDSVTTGRYHHGQLLKSDHSRWRDLERRMALHRRLCPHYVLIARFIAQKASTTTEKQ